MLKYFILFVCLINILFYSFSLQGDPLSLIHMHEIIPLARDYRLHMDLSSEEEINRKKALLNQLIPLLPEYNEPEITQAVSHFLTDCLGEAASQFTIVDAKTAKVKGRSRDLVFLIQDQKGDFIYVVKAFRTPFELSSRFLQEISALDFLAEWHISGTQPVLPLAGAICHYENIDYGLLLETAAPGKRIDEHLKKMTQFSIGTVERQQYMQILFHIFERIGNSFAHLHVIQPLRSGPIPEEFVTKIKEQYEEVLDNSFVIEKLKAQGDFSSFQHSIEQVIEEAQSCSVIYGYRHGDAHFGNLIYDLEKDVLSFIDVAKLHDSVSHDGLPLSEGTYEVIKIEESLRKKAIGVLTEEEIETLLSCFYASYQNTSKLSLNSSLLNFYQVFRQLRRLNDYSQFEKESDPIEREVGEKLFRRALLYFLSMSCAKSPIFDK